MPGCNFALTWSIFICPVLYVPFVRKFFEVSLHGQFLSTVYNVMQLAVRIERKYNMK